VKPAPLPSVNGNTEAGRMDNEQGPDGIKGGLTEGRGEAEAGSETEETREASHHNTFHLRP